jgi:hypothetical protein
MSEEKKPEETKPAPTQQPQLTREQQITMSIQQLQQESQSLNTQIRHMFQAIDLTLQLLIQENKELKAQNANLTVIASDAIKKVKKVKE